MRSARVAYVANTGREISGQSKISSDVMNLFRSCRWIAVAIVMTLLASTAPGQAQKPAPSTTAKPAPSSTAKPAQSSTTAKTRTEKDLLGEKEVPANAYYGVQTARALYAQLHKAGPS